MSNASESKQRAARQLDAFAEMVVSVARAAGVRSVICVTETGKVFKAVEKRANGLRVIAATPSKATYDSLEEGSFEVVKLPVRVSNRFKQAQHALSIALRAKKVSAGELTLCAIGQGIPGAKGDFLILMDVEDGTSHAPLHDLVKLKDDICPAVLDAVLEIACKIGRSARRGNRLGAIFAIGDSERVLEGSRQLVLNPFQGHPRETRMVTNPATRSMLAELSKLDGAFVLRGDGFIQTAGVYLSAGSESVNLSQGLGARHMTAAAVTARTCATAVVVSATDGLVRVFSQGDLVMRIDPDVPEDWLDFDN